MGFTYKTWAASWGTSWLNSWGTAAAAVPAPEARPSGLPAWLKKRMVESHLRYMDEEKRKQYVKRIALLLLGD